MNTQQRFGSRLGQSTQILVLAAIPFLFASVASAGEEVKGAVTAVATGVAVTAAVGAVENGKEGGKEAAKCSPYSPLPCIKSALLFATVPIMMSVMNSAGKTKSGFQAGGTGDFSGDFGDGNTNYEGLPSAGELANLKAKVNQGLKDLEKKGYKLDPKTGDLTTPKGKFPGRALGSAQAMAAAGLISPEEVAEMDQALKKMNDKYRVVSMGLSGGGGGGGGSSARSSYTYEDPYKNMYGGFGDGEKPNAPKTDGLTRTLASGESIGSQVDNIFHMISRRYQAKSEENIFVGQQPGQQPGQ